VHTITLCTQAKYEALAAADKERFAAEVAALNSSDSSDSSSSVKSTTKRTRKPASSKASSSSSSSSCSDSGTSAAAAAVKNPRNAYILYGSAKRDSVKAELAAAAAAAAASSGSSSDSSSAAAIGSNASIMKEIARLWRKASPDEKVRSYIILHTNYMCMRRFVSIMLCKLD
jgi:hypothetical protein